MRPVWAFVVLLLFVVCTSMTQCPKCIKGELRIDKDAKRWLPYSGKDSIEFINDSGVKFKFRCYFRDTSHTYKNYECDDYYKADSLGASLEVSPSDSLMLSTNISSPSWTCFRVLSRNTYFLSGCNILNGPNGEMRSSYSNLVLNGFLYKDVRLVNGYPGTNPLFDSIYYGKDYGIISFKYNNAKYYLKQ